MKWNGRLKYECQLERDDFFRQVKERLFAGDHLTFVVQHDLSNDGKKTLAEALVIDKQIQAHFYDGILRAQLGPHPNILGQFARWGQFLGVVPSQVRNLNSREAWRQALQTAIGTRRLLLIIEDAWTVEDALAFQIGGPRCTYLLTTCLSNRELIPV